MAKAEEKKPSRGTLNQWAAKLISVAILTPVHFQMTISSTPVRSKRYEGWNFNSGNYLFTTDTK